MVFTERSFLPVCVGSLCSNRLFMYVYAWCVVQLCVIMDAFVYSGL